MSVRLRDTQDVVINGNQGVIIIPMQQNEGNGYNWRSMDLSGLIGLANVEFRKTQVGVVSPFAGQDSEIPTGYLKADGSEVSRTEYPELFQKIGVGYGAGDNVNTFNLPKATSHVNLELVGQEIDIDTLADAEDKYAIYVEHLNSRAEATTSKEYYFFKKEASNDNMLVFVKLTWIVCAE